jgi:hypothetical protein
LSTICQFTQTPLRRLNYHPKLKSLFTGGRLRGVNIEYVRMFIIFYISLFIFILSSVLYLSLRKRPFLLTRVLTNIRRCANIYKRLQILATRMRKVKSFKALRIRRGRCQICGISRKSHIQQFGKDLQVHHLFNISYLDCFSEHLLLLCSSCHRKCHRSPREFNPLITSWNEAFWTVPLPWFQDRIARGFYRPYYWEDKIRDWENKIRR